MKILISDIFVTATSSGKCKSLLKTNCGGGVKAPSCHFCYSKYGTRRCGGDCEYNPYIGRCEKSKCLVLSRNNQNIGIHFHNKNHGKSWENDKNNKVNDRYEKDKCRWIHVPSQKM